MHRTLFKKSFARKMATTCVLSLLLQILSPLMPLLNGSSIAYADTGPCGVSTQNGPAILPQYGGVKLDKAATFLANMSDITGAYYDQARNVIVFVGKTNTTLPQFDKDDLAVAIRALIFNNTIPAVSIDFKDLNNILTYPTMKVSMYGGIEDTNFGKVLFDADTQLKRYVIGNDEGGTPIQTSVPGYQSVLSRFVGNGPDVTRTIGNISRWWISPQLITLKKDSATNSFVFDQVVMQVQSAPLVANNDPAWDRAAQDFATHQTQYYDAFAAEVPSYAKAKQLGKITSVIKWLKDNQIATDYSWARNYTPTFVPTPREVPRITSGTLRYTVGNYWWDFYITGGVQYTTPNSYTTDTTGAAAQMKAASAAAASSSTDGVSWAFTSNGQTYNAVSVSADLFRSVGAYAYTATDASVPSPLSVPFALTRTYSSFATDKNSGFGRAWNFIPATLTDGMPTAIAGCSVPGGYTGTYPYNLAVTTPAGRETFTYWCGTGYVADDPSFHSKLIRDASGVFTLTTKDRVSYAFAATSVNGDFPLQKIGDANNLSRLAYLYGINGPSSITDTVSGQQITFAYNASGLINSVSSPSSTLQYGYDANGDLASVTDPRGNTTQYQYAPAHFLKAVIDQGGAKQIDNTYDANGKVIAQTDASGVTRTITYDVTARSVVWKDSNGRTQQDVYDNKARPIQSINPIGATTTITYGATSNMPASVIDARGGVTSLTYDSGGNPLSYTAPDGGKILYTWDSLNNLTQTSDQRYSAVSGLPKQVTYAYDANGNRTQANVAGLTTTNFTYTPQGKLASITDQLGNTTHFTYSSNGLPLTVQDALGNTTTYTYDTAGHPLQITDPSAVISSFTSDANGNRLSATTPAGTTSYTYDANNRLLTLTDPSGATARRAYDSAGNLTTVTDPLGAITQYAYDPYKNMVKSTDALSHDSTFSYDALNRETSYKTPAGKTWASQYDALGNPLTKTLPNGVAQTATYDALNRIVSAQVGTTTLAYTYDSAGRLTKVTGPAGATAYGYDIKDRLTSITDPYGNTVAYQYDTLDNLTGITYPDGKMVQNQFDAAGRLKQQTDWNGGITSYTYTVFGAISTKTLANGITETYAYDSANRLATITYASLAQSILFRQTYQRDARGFVTKITEDGAAGGAGATLYAYDAAGRLTSALGLNATTTYAFDPVGNATGVNVAATDLILVTATTTANIFKDAATTTTTTLTTGTATTVNATTTTQLRDGSSSTVYATSSVTLAPSTTAVTKSSITPSTATATSPETTKTDVSQSYATTTAVRAPTTTNTGRALITTSATTTTVVITKVTVATTSGTFLTIVASVTTTLVAVPRLTQTTNAYSPDNELLSSTISGAAPTTTVAYSYDANGNLQTVAAGASTKTYSWTPLDQLSAATVPSAPTASFTYDASGNRIGKSGASTNIFKDAATTTTTILITGIATTVYATTTTQLRGGVSTVYATSSAALTPTTTTATKSTVATSTATATSPETTKTDVSQSYATTTTASAPTTTNTGRALITTSATTTTVVLTKVTVATTSSTFMLPGGSSTTRYVNDVSIPNERVLEEMNTSNISSRINVWGVGGLVSSGGAGTATRLYPLADAQGTTRFLTNSSGNIVQTYTYSPYGQVAAAAAATTTPYLYTGENLDQETGLYYLRARYYDPTTGRFISRDPVRGTLDNPLTQNPYIYGADNPMMYTDPSGKFVPLLIFLGAVAIAYFTNPIIGSPCGDVNPTPEQFADANQLATYFTIASLAGGGEGAAGRDVVNFTDHALLRMGENGITKATVLDIMKKIKPIEYFHEGVDKLGYYDEATKIFIAQVKETGNLTTIIPDVVPQYIKNLLSL